MASDNAALRAASAQSDHAKFRYIAACDNRQVPVSMLVREEGPGGDRLDEASVPWRVPQGVLNFRDTPLLVAVDPLGDTVFNRFQIERQLPREVEHLRRQLTAMDAVQMLDELERLMTVATEQVHRYLWFIGD